MVDHALVLVDPAGRVQTWNRGAEKMYGHAAGELLGQHVSILLPVDERGDHRFEHELGQALLIGHHEDEGWHLRQDGTRFWASVIVSLLRDEHGEPQGFALIIRDHTEHHEADEELRLREERLRRLLDSIREYAVFTLDPSGKIASWNAGAERIMQYTEPEVLGRHFSIFYSQEQVQAGKCEQVLQLAQSTGRFEEEGWRYCKDGSRLWASVTVSPIRDEGGRLVGFSKVTRDLSERRRAEDRLQQSEQRYRQLVDSIHDYAVFMLDPQGYVATWNAGAERIKGYKADEIIGKHFSVFYPVEDVRAGKCDMELSVATTTGRFEDEGWRLRKDGTRFFANVVINAVRNEYDFLVGFSKVTRDLTERRRTEEAQAARLVAERANEAKDEFLAMLGHELRNPLAPIVTALQLIGPRANELGAREVGVISRQVKHMVRLVDDLLDVSRLARGKVELSLTRVDLRDVLSRAIELASPLLETRRHHLKLSVSEEIIVFGDEGRLVQVFGNLLTNSAKYTDPGGHIVVTVRGEADQAIVEISDDGKGIAPELLAHIFEPFVQGQQSSERSVGGLGIGLSLVRSLLEAHRGSIEARSPGPGGGATFTARLPRGEAVVSAPAPAAADGSASRRLVRAAHPCRILFVDDNDDARELGAMMLRRVGHDVVTAADAVEALEEVKVFVPDVAVLDIGLPVLDGYELALRLRDVLGAWPLKLIALTGYGQAHDRERSARAGFDRHLVKPIEARELLEAIDAVRT
jgi:PAS domain S-box-containing protein